MAIYQLVNGNRINADAAFIAANYPDATFVSDEPLTPIPPAEDNSAVVKMIALGQSNAKARNERAAQKLENEGKPTEAIALRLRKKLYLRRTE